MVLVRSDIVERECRSAVAEGNCDSVREKRKPVADERPAPVSCLVGSKAVVGDRLLDLKQGSATVQHRRRLYRCL